MSDLASARLGSRTQGVRPRMLAPTSAGGGRHAPRPPSCRERGERVVGAPAALPSLSLSRSKNSPAPPRVRAAGAQGPEGAATPPGEGGRVAAAAPAASHRVLLLFESGAVGARARATRCVLWSPRRSPRPCEGTVGGVCVRERECCLSLSLCAVLCPRAREREVKAKTRSLSNLLFIGRTKTCRSSLPRAYPHTRTHAHAADWETEWPPRRLYTRTHSQGARDPLPSLAHRRRRESAAESNVVGALDRRADVHA